MSRKHRVLLQSVNKEELVILIKHRDEATILNQFIYWTSRTETFEQFLIEEKMRMESEIESFEGGWIYKTAK